MYDFYDPAHVGRVFSERNTEGLKMVKSIGFTGHKIRWTYTNLVNDEAKLDELFTKYIDHGFEGQMIRWDEAYANKRTKALLKRKDFIDEEYVLVDIEDGAGNRAGLATVAYFEHPKGEVIRDGKNCFGAGVIGAGPYTADLLKNKKKVLGKKATVCFFNYTPDGVPRFGKMKIVRDYE